MGQEIVTVWSHHDGSFGGISPASDREFVRSIENNGHAITTDSSYVRPMNHYVAGIGVGHDDAMFSETGGTVSMAAYYENGGSGSIVVPRWWDDDSHFTNRAYYDQTHPRFAAKTGKVYA